MKIGIISDTHGKLHPPVLELTASCDVVLHAGDVDNSQTLDQLWMHLQPNAPFYLVRGNNDRGWAERIAKTQRFCQAGVSFFMVHDRKDVSWDLDGVQVVVFGHSHKFTVEEIDGRLWLNPGSCGYKRNTLPLSMAVMTIEDCKYTVETIWLEKGYGTPEAAIAQREKTKVSKYEKKQKRYQQKQLRDANDAKEKELLFTIAKVLRFKKSGESRLWIIKNVGNDPQLTAKIYDICDTLSDTDARSIREKLGDL